MASNFSGRGATYTATVTPDEDYRGDVTVSVAADAAHHHDIDHSGLSPYPIFGSGIGGERTSLNKYWLSAARLTTFGSVLQAYSRDYTKTRRMKVMEIDQERAPRTIPAIPQAGHALSAYRTMRGSKIALFGVQRSGREGGGLNRRQVFKNEIMKVVHGIERSEGLPYTTENGGVMSKIAEDAKEKIYLVATTFAGSNETIQAGLGSLYLWHSTTVGGVYKYAGLGYPPIDEAGIGESNDKLKNLIRGVQGVGVRFGNHYLPGFANFSLLWNPTNSPTSAPIDPYISTRSADLGYWARSSIVGSLSASHTEVLILGQDKRFDKFYATMLHLAATHESGGRAHCL